MPCCCRSSGSSGKYLASRSPAIHIIIAHYFRTSAPYRVNDKPYTSFQLCSHSATGTSQREQKIPRLIVSSRECQMLNKSHVINEYGIYHVSMPLLFSNASISLMPTKHTRIGR
jgi:hypothetical protein